MNAHARLGSAVALILLAAGLAGAAQPATPPTYVLDYPAASEFCAPVATYFDDVDQFEQTIGGRTIRHPLNGGFGLPVVKKLGGKNLLHLGADVAWQQPGAKVHSIAAGVVRISTGPQPSARKKSSPGGSTKRAGPLEWGNIIVIEHRLADGSFVTSIYGHLSARRLVEAGDIVEAGQMIGAEGRPGTENGGYKAHLHFALRQGRMAAPGARIGIALTDGRVQTMKLGSIEAGQMEILAVSEPMAASLAIGGQQFPVTRRDGKNWVSADALAAVSFVDFPIVGYGLNKEGWLDPTEFLRDRGAEFAPAPHRDPAITVEKAANSKAARSKVATPKREGLEVQPSDNADK
jgi:murein DD-endopeptidase MepM/ murein hydrolase activator NlpD